MQKVHRVDGEWKSELKGPLVQEVQVPGKKKESRYPFYEVNINDVAQVIIREMEALPQDFPWRVYQKDLSQVSSFTRQISSNETEVRVVFHLWARIYTEWMKYLLLYNSKLDLIEGWTSHGGGAGKVQGNEGAHHAVTPSIYTKKDQVSSAFLWGSSFFWMQMHTVGVIKIVNDFDGEIDGDNVASKKLRAVSFRIMRQVVGGRNPIEAHREFIAEYVGEMKEALKLSPFKNHPIPRFMYLQLRLFYNRTQDERFYNRFIGIDTFLPFPEENAVTKSLLPLRIAFKQEEEECLSQISSLVRQFVRKIEKTHVLTRTQEQHLDAMVKWALLKRYNEFDRKVLEVVFSLKFAETCNRIEAHRELVNAVEDKYYDLLLYVGLSARNPNRSTVDVKRTLRENLDAVMMEILTKVDVAEKKWLIDAFIYVHLRSFEHPDQVRNGWNLHTSGLPFIQKDYQATANLLFLYWEELFNLPLRISPFLLKIRVLKKKTERDILNSLMFCQLLSIAELHRRAKRHGFLYEYDTLRKISKGIRPGGLGDCSKSLAKACNVHPITLSAMTVFEKFQ